MTSSAFQTPPTASPAARSARLELPRPFMATCSWCRAEVQVLPTPQGVLMPLELAPWPAGRVAITRWGAALPLTAGQALRWPRPRWRSHYEVCSRIAAAGSHVTCPAPGCDVPMAVSLLLVGEASHPTCRPAGADRGLIAGAVTRIRKDGTDLPALAGHGVARAGQTSLTMEESR